MVYPQSPGPVAPGPSPGPPATYPWPPWPQTYPPARPSSGTALLNIGAGLTMLGGLIIGIGWLLPFETFYIVVGIGWLLLGPGLGIALMGIAAHRS